MEILKIGKKIILTQKNFVYIIAEAGIGYFESLLLAKKLVNLAKTSGANAIKFQACLT
jgi:sialic acid synthase SpsE